MCYDTKNKHKQRSREMGKKMMSNTNIQNFIEKLNNLAFIGGTIFLVGNIPHIAFSNQFPHIFKVNTIKKLEEIENFCNGNCLAGDIVLLLPKTSPQQRKIALRLHEKGAYGLFVFYKTDEERKQFPVTKGYSQTIFIPEKITHKLFMMFLNKNISSPSDLFEFI